MIRVSQWAEIRHMHLVEGVAKKSVARRLGLDVKTVRRALAKEKAPSTRASPPRVRVLDTWRKEIEAWIRADPRISSKRLWILLGERGARVTDRAVRKYVAELRAALYPPEVFVHRTHAPGDSAEVDFGECFAEVAGKVCRAKVLISVLPASNVYFAKAYPLERLECLLDGMSESFRWFGGVPRRVVLDNTSLVVKKILRGAEREETRAFHAWRGTYPLHADFCAPGKGWEKGSVERGVQYVRGLCFRPMPRAASWEELNRMLLAELERDLDRRSLPDGRTARSAKIAECEHLRPLPAHPPESCRVVPCVADKYAMVAVDRSRYSVPPNSARRALVAKLFWDRIEVFQGAERVAIQSRSYREGSQVVDPLHVLALLEQKHRAVNESTAIQGWKLPAVLYELRGELRKRVKRPDQEWVRVLRLLEEHSMEELEAAVAQAIERGSPKLETIRMLIRQQQKSELEIRPAAVARADLAAIAVAQPELASYDELVEVAS